jgi:hypothetical protein
MAKSNQQTFLDGDDLDEIKFAEWEGDAVLLRWDEAWLYNERTGWREIDAADACHKAGLLTREGFEQLFPGALASLPAPAFGGEPRNYSTRDPFWFLLEA